MHPISEQARRQQRSERERAVDGDRILTFREWCLINGFSVATGKRLRKAGRGPVITRISDRRIGIRVADNRAWQQARAKPESSEVS
jgi:hypothetical protein